MNKKLWCFLVVACGLMNLSESQAFNFADYFPLTVGNTWCYAYESNPENTFADSVCCSQEIEGQPAVRLTVSSEGFDLVCWNDGISVTLYGVIEGAVTTDFTPPLVLGTMEDGAKFDAPCANCSAFLIRTWDSLDPEAASVYGIDPAYGDLVVWATYDADDVPNSQNAIIESNLPAGMVPPVGAVTDLDWYQIGVGLTVHIGVDAFTGELGYKYELVDCIPVQVDETSWGALKALYRHG